MSTLKDAQAAYRTAVDALKVDPTTAPKQFRPGVQMQHSLLTQKLPSLLAAFSEALHEQTFGFVPVGLESASWARTAHQEATDGILVDTLGIYKDLASDRIWNSMDRVNRLFGPTQYSILDDELREYGEKLTDEHIPFPDYFNQAAVFHREDLAVRVQAVMERSFGLKYRILYIKKAITDAAAGMDLQGTTVPVILSGVELMNTASELALGVFAPNRYTLVNVENLGGAEFVKQSVQKAFAEVKKSLRRKAQPNTNTKDTNTNG